MITIRKTGANAQGHDVYRCAPRGFGYAYEIIRNGPRHAYYARPFEIVRVGPGGERTTIADAWAYGPPRTIRECESIVTRDLTGIGYR